VWYKKEDCKIFKQGKDKYRMQRQQKEKQVKSDDKNIELLRLIAHLRDHIDIHRIIGLNIKELPANIISRALLGHLSRSAHESLAIYICKIFESSPRNDLNSIPGIIESLPSTSLCAEQQHEFVAFGMKYGNHANFSEVRSYLKGTFGLFSGIHSKSLAQLKEFRDKIGAHSDSKATIKSLPSHAEFEIFFSFAKDFYELISNSVHHVDPAPITSTVGRGFMKLIKSIGVLGAKFDYDKEV